MKINYCHYTPGNLHLQLNGGKNSFFKEVELIERRLVGLALVEAAEIEKVSPGTKSVTFSVSPVDLSWETISCVLPQGTPNSA